MSGGEYHGPETVSYIKFPGRGRVYKMLVEDHTLEITVSEKGHRVRVFVDGDERR